MKRLSPLSILSFLTLFSCYWLPPSTEEARTIVEEIKEEFAPDKRVALFDIKINNRLEGIRVTGKTNLPEAKQILFKKLKEKEFTIIDSLVVLPDESVGSKQFGIVNVSVCNIRSKKGHSQELATQAILGTPLRVYEKIGGWFRVQTPDGYIGWLDEGGFEWMEESEYQDWISSPKVIYIGDFGFSYQSPDLDAPKISDLTSGNILQSVGMSKDFIEIAYPDRRRAFVTKEAVVDYHTWLATRTPTAYAVVEVAKEFLGRPYLWGGTSGKGVDCSGFTKMVYFLNGIQLARDASQQVHTGVEITTDSTLKNIKPGDLLFFGQKATPTTKEKIRHVAIYIGNGEMIHASGDAGVKIESLYPDAPNFAEERLNTFVKAKRVLISLGRNGIHLLKDLPEYNGALL